MLRKYSLPTLHATALALTIAWTLSSSAAEFGYHDPVGPGDWCGLSADYDACCGAGGEQSPIDINSSNIDFLRPLPVLKFKLPGVTSLSVVNNGHTVQANVPSGEATLELDGTIYDLLQFHFHTPSEHTVDGEHAPLEMHLVHKTADGSKTAVVGVFIVAGKEHKELGKIWENLPDEESEQIEVTGFHPHNILPGKKSSFRYPGSLTTPPCTEGVSWNILSTPISMSMEQIEKFQGVFSGVEFPNGNARPTQPLGDRIVTTDSK